MVSYHSQTSLQPLVRLLAAACIGLATQFTFTPKSYSDSGDLYATDLATGSVIRYSPDGTPHTFATGLVSPQGIAFDQATDTSAAYFYVADQGDGGATSGIIYRYDRNGNRTTFATGLDRPIGVAIDGGDLIVAENGADRIRRLPFDGSASTISLIIDSPVGVDVHAFDQSGFLTKFIANGESVFRLDPAKNAIPEDIDPESTDVTHSVGVDPLALDVYTTTEAGELIKLSADGSSRTLFATGFTNPQGIAFVPSGVPNVSSGIYVADPDASTIFRVPTNGIPVVFVTGGSPNFIAFQSNSGPDPTPPPTPTPTPTPSGTPTPTPSPTPTPTPTPTPLGKPLNLSTRVDVQTGDDIAIGGFILTDAIPATKLAVHSEAVTATKTIAIRAIGPSLGSFGVTDTLADPVLELHDSTGAIIATNDNWTDNSDADKAIITANNLDMFGLTGSQVMISDSESIIIANLAVRDATNDGAYTAVMRGSGDTTGVGLVEIYDLDAESTPTELGNMSTRGIVGTTEDVLIGGIIVGPSDNSSLNTSVVVRSLGPSLANSGITDPLADPMLQILNADGFVIADNDNWQDFDGVQDVKDAGLQPSDDNEAAIFANLIPGQYTAIAMGVNGGTGVALIEIYHVAAPTPAK